MLGVIKTDAERNIGEGKIMIWHQFYGTVDSVDIDIMGNFAFVNVDNSIYRQVLEKCTGGKINKRRVNVEVSTNNKKKSRNRNRKSKNS